MFKRFNTQTLFSYSDAQSPLVRYGLAVLAVAAAALATQTIPVIGQRAAFMFFFVAIIQTSYWLGHYPGLFVLALALLTVNGLVLLPTWALEPGNVAILNLGFMLVSANIIYAASHHRQLAAKLWLSEQDLNHAQAVAQTGSWRLDVRHNQLRWSAENHRIFGIPTGIPLTYESFLTAIHPEDREYVDQKWQAALSGEPYDIDHRIIVKGEVRWVREKAVLEFDQSGELLGGFGTTQDITELRQNKLMLVEIEQQYAGIVKSAMDAIITIDTDQRIVVFNAAAERMLGCAADEAIGESIERFIPTGSRLAHGEHIRDFGCTGSGNRKMGELGAIYGLRSNGEEFPIEVSISQAMINGKKSYTAILRDITERKRAEEELRNAQARLNLVVEEVKVGYWDWDLLTRSFYASPEWKWQLGIDNNTPLDSLDTWQSRVHPDDQAFVLTAAEDYIVGKQAIYELDYRLRHQDGSYRWIHSRGVLLRDRQNHPYRLLGLNLDITDYKQSSEFNARRNRMEQSFRTYVASQTAAAIAHELNQPLTAISYYADVAQELLQTGIQDPQKLSEIMEKCSQQALRAGSVIRQLMAILHKGEAANEPIDINIAVREAVSFVMTDGQLGDFKIDLDLTAALPLVTANNLQIQKVLINLLHNGSESMQESGGNVGTIKIITRPATDDPSFAQITVIDCGKGVTDIAMLKTIFQPFHTTKPAGLGMGLAISRALIEAHNGKMWAEQNAGPGLSIHFTLPFAL